MAIRRRPPRPNAIRGLLEQGAKVRSVAVGSRAAFDGRVVGRARKAYIVEDESGDRWHREEHELRQ